MINSRKFGKLFEFISVSTKQFRPELLQSTLHKIFFLHDSSHHIFPPLSVLLLLLQHPGSPLQSPRLLLLSSLQLPPSSLLYLPLLPPWNSWIVTTNKSLSGRSSGWHLINSSLLDHVPGFDDEDEEAGHEGDGGEPGADDGYSGHPHPWRIYDEWWLSSGGSCYKQKRHDSGHTSGHPIRNHSWQVTTSIFFSCQDLVEIKKRRCLGKVLSMVYDE